MQMCMVWGILPILLWSRVLVSFILLKLCSMEGFVTGITSDIEGSLVRFGKQLPCHHCLSTQTALL